MMKARRKLPAITDRQAHVLDVMEAAAARDPLGRVPTETELARSLRINRSAVRKHAKKLAVRGCVIREGRGQLSLTAIGVEVVLAWRCRPGADGVTKPQ